MPAPAVLMALAVTGAGWRCRTVLVWMHITPEPVRCKMVRPVRMDISGGGGSYLVSVIIASGCRNGKGLMDACQPQEKGRPRSRPDADQGPAAITSCS